jgi:rhodanese-related sulfurtransferase
VPGGAPACDDDEMSTGAEAAPAPTISQRELVAALAAGRVTLVDVLSPESYAAAHIDGAINLPVAEIAERAGQLLPNPEATIVAYCGGPT